MADDLQTWHRSLINGGLLVEALEYRDPPSNSRLRAGIVYVRGVLSVFDDLVKWELVTGNYEILGRVCVTSHNAVSTPPYIWIPSVCQRYSLTVVGAISRFTEVQVQTFRHCAVQLVLGNGQLTLMGGGHYVGRHTRSNSEWRRTEGEAIQRAWADAAKFWGIA